MGMCKNPTKLQFQSILIRNIYIIFIFLTGFNLNSWLTSRNIPINTPTLSEVVVAQLLDTLGVGYFMEDPACNQSDAFYTPTRVDGFKIGKICHYVEHVDNQLPIKLY